MDSHPMPSQRVNSAYDLIEAQVSRTPDAPALIFEDRTFTYRYLHQQASVLSEHLRSLGLSPGMLVGIHLDRSPEMLISVLAVLISGGAYVPLDPEYPKNGLGFMIQDAQLEFILSQPDLEERVTGAAKQLVMVGQVLAAAAPNESDLPSTPAVIVGPENLAYVIYTSGSTGKPKGVEITHGALINFLLAMSEEPGCTRQDIVLGITTLSFDIAVLELLLPLTVGARVAMANRQTASDPRALAALVDQHGVTLMQTTPARWRLLIESGWCGRSGLRALCGGEAMSRELANKLLDRCDELWNMYGPTETTVWVCAHKIERSTEPISIGGPIANTQLFVLDHKLEAVSADTPGELCIGGVQLARGYLRRPELTAEKFVVAAVSGGAPTRIYRTGDLVRRLPCGSIEFIGRLDNQVKIRGRRIEPSEVEAILAQHPEVQYCAVTAYDVDADQKGLAAYIVPRHSLEPAVDEMRQFLRDRLPEQMIPTAFVSLPSLPLTPSGKVNRGALPPPQRSRLLGKYTPPQTDPERKMAEVWQRVLNHPRVGIQDNFFELGGYSLLGIRLINEVNAVLKVNLSPMDLLSQPTIAGLTTLLKESGRRPQQPALVPLQTGSSGLPVFFAWHNTRWDLLRLSQGTADAPQLFITEVPYPPEMLLAAARPEGPTYPTLEELAAPHVALIRQSGLAGPCMVAGCSYGSVLAFEIARQLTEQGIEVSAVFSFDGNILPVAQRVKLQIRHKAKFFTRFLKSKPDPASRIATTSNKPNTTEAPLISPEALDAASWEQRWPYINRIWLHLMWHYSPRPVRSKGILFRALDNGTYYTKDEDFDGFLGWSKLFTGGVKIVPVPGNHFNMWEAPHVRELNRQWAATLGSMLNSKSQPS